MEESQNQPQGNGQPQEEKVSFPTVGGEQKGNGAKTLLIIGILVLIGILGYVIYKSANTKNQVTEEVIPTPYENMATPLPEVSPTPVSSPSASVDKTKIKIQVQNGTGITGEAAYLETQLSGIGYTNISVGNSETQSETDTSVSFGSSVPTSVADEITTKLKTIYQNVVKTTSSSTTYDVVVITGLRKGATPKATASAAPSPTATP